MNEVLRATEGLKSKSLFLGLVNVYSEFCNMESENVHPTNNSDLSARVGGPKLTSIRLSNQRAPHLARYQPRSRPSRVTELAQGMGRGLRAGLRRSSTSL